VRKPFVILAVVAVLAASFAGSAGADPSASCAGKIASGVAATWPWAHEGHEFFAPPKGGLAKFVEELGPVLGFSSVRELQEMFCAGEL
jgi:hypothetical protein